MKVSQGYYFRNFTLLQKKVSISIKVFVLLSNELGETLANEFTSVVIL